MKKKGQDKALSKSLSKRKTLPENHQSTSIGCMSGIFHMVSKYHQRRKFITSGNDTNHKTTSTTTLASASPKTDSDFKSVTQFSDIKRSPTITSEIRRSPAAETITEKRRKLMESLQKCEEDLDSLKKVIEAVQSTGYLRGGKGGGGVEMRKECLIVQVDGRKDGKKGDGEQPSPVSVLEDINASPSPVHSSTSTGAEIGCTDLSFSPKITLEAIPILFNHKEDKQCGYFGSTRTASKTSLASPYWSSKAKVECVNEVYREAVWEERWELERVGAMLEDYMFWDLIEETVRELGCCHMNSLPFEVCRRRLQF